MVCLTKVLIFVAGVSAAALQPELKARSSTFGKEQGAVSVLPDGELIVTKRDAESSWAKFVPRFWQYAKANTKRDADADAEPLWQYAKANIKRDAEAAPFWQYAKTKNVKRDADPLEEISNALTKRGLVAANNEEEALDELSKAITSVRLAAKLLDLSDATKAVQEQALGVISDLAVSNVYGKTKN